jgi:hypothetical protein
MPRLDEHPGTVAMLDVVELVRRWQQDRQEEAAALLVRHYRRRIQRWLFRWCRGRPLPFPEQEEAEQCACWTLLRALEQYHFRSPPEAENQRLERFLFHVVHDDFRNGQRQRQRARRRQEWAVAMAAASALPFEAGDPALLLEQQECWARLEASLRQRDLLDQELVQTIWDGLSLAAGARQVGL